MDRMYYINEDGTYNNVPDTLVPGEKGSNQAVAAARAGAKVAMISKVSSDMEGAIILQNLIDSYSNELIINNKDLLLNSKFIVSQLKAPEKVCKELINFCYKNDKKLIITPCHPGKLKNDLQLLDNVISKCRNIV